MINFTVLGNPRGKGRHRFTRNGHAYTDSETRAYERKVRQSYLAAGGTKIAEKREAVRAVMSVYYPIPQSWPLKKQQEALAGDIPATCKPDADNVAKTVQDALNGIAYDDDKQVVLLHVEKAYSATPRVEVAITAGGGGKTCERMIYACPRALPHTPTPCTCPAGQGPRT